MNTLPREIVVDVLKRVPFKQLFGHCSLINKEFRALIYNPPIPFPIAADFSIKASNRFSQSSATKVLDFIPKVDGKRVVKLNLANLSKMPKKSYSTILQAFPNLRVLKFKRSFELSDEVAQRIPEFCPLIEILSIELVHIERLDFIFDLKYLRELNLKGCIQLSTETTPFEELIKRPNKIPLKRLQLPKYLDNEILQHSGSIFPQLETLLLPGYNYLTDVAVQNMPKTLTELNFRDVVEIEPRHMTAICQQCPKLKILDVWGVKISDESIKNLLENCKELETLVWSLHKNTNSALKMLGGYDRSLKKLVIHFPAHGIKNDGFQALHLTQNRLEELYLLAFRQAPAVSCVNLIEANAPTLRKLIMKSIPYDRQMLPKIAKCKNLTHLAIDVDEQNLELWKDLFASLINLKWLYIKNTDVLVNLESLLGGCSSLQKLVVEEDRWESPPSLANRNIRLSVTPIGWNYEGFIKEAKAITKQNFGLDQEAV